MTRGVAYKFFLGLAVLLFSITQLQAQFNNAWIDYSKTYYKFKVGEDGLYRIPMLTLQAAGLSTTNAEYFQLWRNGVEVPLYTSVSSGQLGSADYLEFYGKMNDGKVDAALYKVPAHQLSDKFSLQTDTAAYFLTVNSANPNARITASANNVSSNTLPVEPYFMHTLSRNFKDQINPGLAAVVGVYVYSSSYDNGEGWSSRNINPSNPLVEQYSDLKVSPLGPDPSFRITAFGNAQNPRRLQVMINGNFVFDNPMNYFVSLIRSFGFTKSQIGRTVDTIRIINGSDVSNDRITLGKYELTYPRQFDFGGSQVFEFSLPATTAGNFLEITNFNSNSAAPVLYDLTNNKRYQADMTVAGKFRFALPAGLQRNFVLLATSPAQFKNVSGLQRKKFVDYSLAAAQGDYLIISHNSIRKSSSGDALQNYQTYRSSVEGGSYKVGIYDIDELVDQFAFGIKKHPLSIKNFLEFVRTKYSLPIKYILLVGKGITYDQYRYNENRGVTESINLIPTFGNPGSDNILASTSLDPTPETPIGRISVTTGDELMAYLEKVKEHNLVLNSANQTVQDKAWMKNFAHVIGGGDPFLQATILGYMNTAGNLVKDTSYGAKVYNFEKVTSAGIDLVNSGALSSLFNEGMGMITYFGHSSANSMEFNLDDPTIFENPGKYPLFLANGCNSGNFFIYDTLRSTTGKKSITENYVLTPKRGSIGFLASTHFGIVNYLNLYTYNLYRRISQQDYMSNIGELQLNTLNDVLTQGGSFDFFNQITVEQILLGGDPAVSLYPQPLPDYAIEEPLIRVSPNPLNITNSNFDLKVKFYNIGKATRDSLRVTIKRELPDGTVVVLYDAIRKPLFNVDSIEFSVPINPLNDKGQNKILVSLDGSDLIKEITNINNSASKVFSISEDDVRPVSPQQFAIVNTNSVKLIASTSLFFQTPTNFILEVDTTELFNSPLKVTQNQTSLGGLIEFSPSLQLRDSLVFYWRVARATTSSSMPVQWSSTSSFVYLSNSSTGWNQSHYYQYLKNTYTDLKYNTNRFLAFDTEVQNLRVTSRLHPYGFNTVANNLDLLYSSSCFNAVNSFEFTLIDMAKASPIENPYNTSGTLYNSIMPNQCRPVKLYQFWYYYNQSSYRKFAMEFLDKVPSGTLLVLNNWASLSYNSSPEFIDKWQQDTLIYGSNNSIYHRLKSIGFTLVDSFTKSVPFLFVAEKLSNGEWKVLDQKIGESATDVLNSEITYESIISSGRNSHQLVGPAKSWGSIHWKGSSQEKNSKDKIAYKVFGLSGSSVETLLYQSEDLIKDTSLTFIDAQQFPFLRIQHESSDTLNYSPWQPRYLQVKYSPVPEGSLTSGVITMVKDTLEIGEPMRFSIAFKNISDLPFDSVMVYMTLTDPKNNTRIVLNELRKPIIKGDTILIDFTVDTKTLAGDNTIFINFNPNYHQPEQNLFNNYLTKVVHVRADTYAPNLDVTFDGVHILNKDIVSPKPTILIKLKDDSKYLALNDTSLFKVQLRYPDGSLRTIRFDNDTLQFNPSTNPLGGNNNEASILFKPFLTEDGEYELIVTAKDRSGNLSGAIVYSVLFQVYTKSMITNLLNYPNPFTTSTAFVFTLTGSELPTHFRIQILTVTGKIIREITKEELGPIRIGNNITEYKWDGRDQYGQPVGNGVYLYRVMANINGKQIDKLRAGSYNTDSYFKSGYGKMYLMR